MTKENDEFPDVIVDNKGHLRVLVGLYDDISDEEVEKIFEGMAKRGWAEDAGERWRNERIVWKLTELGRAEIERREQRYLH